MAVPLPLDPEDVPPAWPKPELTRAWVRETVQWLWGIDLYDWQLDDLMSLLQGGILSILYPTDFGKSTLVEMSVTLMVLLDPTRANLVVNASPEKAREAVGVIAFKLEEAAKRYPWARPLVRHSQEGEILAGSGFYVQGGDHGNKNPTVYGCSIGARDLQGRRGRTHIDDVETMREAMHERYRQMLVNRVKAVLRTVERRPDALWAMFGTPYLENTMYYEIVSSLEDLGPQHRIIRRPVIQESGLPLVPEWGEKVEMHRRTMGAVQFQVAYMLQPITFGKPDLQSQQKMLDTTFPFCRTERDFAVWEWSWLAAMMRDPYGHPQPEAQRKAVWAQTRYYFGWDPAARGEWAITVEAVVMGHWFVLYVQKEPGDIFSQLQVFERWLPAFPDAVVIIEGNGQQKTHLDIFQQKFPRTTILPHQTDGKMKSEEIGIPAMLALAKQNPCALHLPYADQDGRRVTEWVMQEVKSYGSLHPHILPAMYFPYFYDQQGGGGYVRQAAPTEDAVKIYRMNDASYYRALSAWGQIRG